MYSPVPRSEIIAKLMHLRDLFRSARPSGEKEQRASDRREAAVKDLLSNLPRTGQHPTLTTLIEIASIFSLTIEAAHSLFGYRLEEFAQWDLDLNGDRTHIIESHGFARDLRIDLPARLAPAEAFAKSALLGDLVLDWHTDVPLRTLEDPGWERPGSFCVHIGTEDSLGSDIPPGATALVEPLSDRELATPNTRHIYLIQFPNGYRCCHCVVTRGKLRPFNTTRAYIGREEFAYPGAVRLAGRIRTFAMSLPPADDSAITSLRWDRRGGALSLPWEHPTRDQLFATKHRRFPRSEENRDRVREILEQLFQARLSARSERRYRCQTESEPHVSSLLHLTLAHFTRYTDVLRAGGSWQSDRKLFSLGPLLAAHSFEELQNPVRNVLPPRPRDVWEARSQEYGGWPTLLSTKFPKLRNWENKIVRLGQEAALDGVNPALGPGSLLLLEQVQSLPDTSSEQAMRGWSRPIYVLRRGMKILCGHLERDGDQLALTSGIAGAVRAQFDCTELPHLSRAAGVAVPV